MSAREIKFKREHFTDDGKHLGTTEWGWLQHNMFVSPGTVHGEHRPNAVDRQYTGLLDKKGVEIYEGDLLDIQAAGGDRGYVPVVFKDGAFMMHIDYWVTEYYHLSDYDGSLYKVIGNIYENRELLDAKGS